MLTTLWKQLEQVLRNVGWLEKENAPKYYSIYSNLINYYAPRLFSLFHSLPRCYSFIRRDNQEKKKRAPEKKKNSAELKLWLWNIRHTTSLFLLDSPPKKKSSLVSLFFASLYPVTLGECTYGELKWNTFLCIPIFYNQLVSSSQKKKYIRAATLSFFSRTQFIFNLLLIKWYHPIFKKMFHRLSIKVSLNSFLLRGF